VAATDIKDMALRHIFGDSHRATPFS